MSNEQKYNFSTEEVIDWIINDEGLLSMTRRFCRRAHLGQHYHASAVSELEEMMTAILQGDNLMGNTLRGMRDFDRHEVDWSAIVDFMVNED